MLWGNLNFNYAQASMGYGNSDLSWGYYGQRGWANPFLVSYMESHDEERIMYKNLNFGSSGPGYSIKELPTALKRIEMISAFFFLVPGPKMIWEFGELGYDFSINYCVNGTINNSCRLDPKPIRWDYLQVDLRKRIYDIDRALISLRNQEAFQEGTFTYSFANQFEKKFHFQHVDMDITGAGNFYTFVRNISPGFTKTGWWYDYLGTDSLFVQKLDTVIAYQPGEYHVYTTRKINLNFDITSAVEDHQVISRPLVISPTINNGSFRISISNTSDIQSVTVSDMSGRMVRTVLEMEADEVYIQLQDVLPGMYIVRMKTPAVNYVGKMVVE